MWLDEQKLEMVALSKHIRLILITLIGSNQTNKYNHLIIFGLIIRNVSSCSAYGGYPFIRFMVLFPGTI